MERPTSELFNMKFIKALTKSRRASLTELARLATLILHAVCNTLRPKQSNIEISGDSPLVKTRKCGVFDEPIVLMLRKDAVTSTEWLVWLVHYFICFSRRTQKSWLSILANFIWLAATGSHIEYIFYHLHTRYAWRRSSVIRTESDWIIQRQASAARSGVFLDASTSSWFDEAMFAKDRTSSRACTEFNTMPCWHLKKFRGTAFWTSFCLRWLNLNTVRSEQSLAKASLPVYAVLELFVTAQNAVCGTESYFQIWSVKRTETNPNQQNVSLFIIKKSFCLKRMIWEAESSEFWHQKIAFRVQPQLHKIYMNSLSFADSQNSQKNSLTAAKMFWPG